MKNIKIIIFVIILLCLTLTGCSTPKRTVYLDILGWSISHDATIRVGDDVNITLYISGATEYGIYELYHWNITDYDRDLITPANGIAGIKFETPGIKTFTVWVTSNYSDFKTNVFTRSIEVLPREE